MQARAGASGRNKILFMPPFPAVDRRNGRHAPPPTTVGSRDTIRRSDRARFRKSCGAFQPSAASVRDGSISAAEIMAGAGHGNRADQPFAKVRRDPARSDQTCAQIAFDVQVRPRLAAADRISRSRLPALQHADQSGGVVLDEKPVANVGAIAVNRQARSRQGVQRDQRNEFVRKLPQAIIVAGVEGLSSAARRCGAGRRTN